MSKGKPRKGGSSHQRTVTRTALVDHRVDPKLRSTPPETKPSIEPAHLNVGDSIGFLSLILTLLFFVLTPPLWLKLFLFGASCAGFFVFIHRSHWTHAWQKWKRNSSGGLIILILCGFGIPQLQQETGPEKRAYLRTDIDGVSLDKPLITVHTSTSNIGALQVLPGHDLSMLFIGLYDHALSADEEDTVFEKPNFGGFGQLGAFIPTNNNYWDHGVAKTLDVSHRVAGESQEEIDVNWNQLIKGETFVYLFARHGVQDKLGTVLNSTCFYFKVPQFRQVRECHGHNGAGVPMKLKRPLIRRVREFLGF